MRQPKYEVGKVYDKPETLHEVVGNFVAGFNAQRNANYASEKDHAEAYAQAKQISERVGLYKSAHNSNAYYTLKGFKEPNTYLNKGTQPNIQLSAPNFGGGPANAGADFTYSGTPIAISYNPGERLPTIADAFLEIPTSVTPGILDEITFMPTDTINTTIIPIRRPMTGVIQLASENTDLDVSLIGAEKFDNHAKLEYKKFRALFGITPEYIALNHYGETAYDRLLEGIGMAMRHDLGHLTLMGDTAIAAVSGDDDFYLKSLDGILKLANSKTFDHGGASFNELAIARCQRNLDRIFYEERPDYKIYLSYFAMQDFSRSVQARLTDLGDRSFLNGGPMQQQGLQLKVLPELRDTLNAAGVIAAAPSTFTSCLYGNLRKYCHAHINRDIELVSEYNKSKDITLLYLKFYFGLTHAYPDATVKGYNILASPTL